MCEVSQISLFNHRSIDELPLSIAKASKFPKQIFRTLFEISIFYLEILFISFINFDLIFKMIWEKNV